MICVIPCEVSVSQYTCVLVHLLEEQYSDFDEYEIRDEN